MICQKQSINSGSGSLGGGTSVWGYLTAGVVAANVVANLVNNANENNNNNNNNDNQDNTNNNNMNIGNSVNSNMNMNIIIPVPGGRSFDQMFKKILHPALCKLLSYNIKEDSMTFNKETEKSIKSISVYFFLNPLCHWLIN